MKMEIFEFLFFEVDFLARPNTDFQSVKLALTYIPVTTPWRIAKLIFKLFSKSCCENILSSPV
jgi:hypothetical protein